MRDNVPTRVNFIENALALGGVIMVISRLVNLSFVLVLKVLTEISPPAVSFFCLYFWWRAEMCISAPGKFEVNQVD